MMKIAFTLGSLNRGGTETLLMDVVQNMQQIEYVVVYRKKGELETVLSEINIPNKHIPVRNPIHYFLDLRKYFKINSIDLVHAHQPLDAFFL